MSDEKGLFMGLTMFNTMVTPKIITFIYWIGLAGVLLSGIGAIVSGHLFAGIGVVVGGGIGWRMWCELLIVFFKMNENLQRIADRSNPPI